MPLTSQPLSKIQQYAIKRKLDGWYESRHEFQTHSKDLQEALPLEIPRLLVSARALPGGGRGIIRLADTRFHSITG